jgi:hypothetical protein
MALSTIVKTLRDGTLTISDNADSNSVVVAFETGDFSLTIPGPAVNMFLDRNRITSPPSLRYGADQPMTGTFTAYLRSLDETGADVLEQLVLLGIPDGWVSTMGASGEVKTVTLEWGIEGSDHGDDNDYSLTCNHCAVSGSITEGDPTTVSFAFTSHDLYPTIAT